MSKIKKDLPFRAEKWYLGWTKGDVMLYNVMTKYEQGGITT